MSEIEGVISQGHDVVGQGVFVISPKGKPINWHLCN